jgi:ParB-like chromosome segregation protein Spo0J
VSADPVLKLPAPHQCRMPNPDDRNRTDPTYVTHRDTMMRPDIRKRGIQVPLLGYEDGEFFQLIDGGTRLECALLEGLTKIPVLVFPQKPDARERRKASFLANETRKDFTPAERNRFYLDEMRANGWNQAQLCKEYGLNLSTLCRRLRWLELVPEDLHGNVGEGDGMIPERGAYALKDPPPEKRRELCERMIAGFLTVESLEGQKHGLNPKRLKVQKIEDGGLSIVCPSDWAASKVAEAIAAILKKVKQGMGG